MRNTLQDVQLLQLHLRHTAGPTRPDTTLTVMISLTARSLRVQFGQPVCVCVCWCFTTGPAARPRLSPGLRKAARCRFVNFHRHPPPHPTHTIVGRYMYYVSVADLVATTSSTAYVVGSYSAASSRSCRDRRRTLHNITISVFSTLL